LEQLKEHSIIFRYDIGLIEDETRKSSHGQKFIVLCGTCRANSRKSDITA
jgi:hypothetical protein